MMAGRRAEPDLRDRRTHVFVQTGYALVLIHQRQEVFTVSGEQCIQLCFISPGDGGAYHLIGHPLQLFEGHVDIAFVAAQ